MRWQGRSMSKLLQAGILIALGAFLFFLAPSAAFSQSGAGYVSGLLGDSNWCWMEEDFDAKGNWIILVSHPQPL